MRTHRLTAASALLLAAGGLVVGLAAPAAGREASHLINGNTIKKHSISGNRLKANTVTGAQIKESTLSAVPTATQAKTLPPLKWHAVTLENGWTNYGDLVERPAAYAVDAQGIVHLRGAIKSGTSGTIAFTLPAGLVPAKLDVDVPMICGPVGNTCYLDVSDNAVAPNDSGVADPGSVANYTSLEGVTPDGH